MSDWAEDDWERLTEYVALPDDVEAIVGEPVRAVTLLTGGKANTNYRVDLDDRSVVLRLYERDRSAAERERRLLDLVGDTVPVPARLGAGVTDSGVPYALFEHIEGVHPHEALAAGVDARTLGMALGRGLARLETIEPPGGRDEIGLFGPDLRFERTFDSVADSFVDLLQWSLREGRAPRRLGDDLTARLAARIDPAARLLDEVDDWRGLAHGDYKFSNLLVDADGTLAAVLDWEFACAYTPLLDVAIMMRHRDDFPPALIEGFEAGHGGLPDEWRRLSRVMDLMNLVGFLNASGERPTLFAHVRARIAATVELLQDHSPAR